MYPPPWPFLADIVFPKDNISLHIVILGLFIILLIVSGFLTRAETVFSSVNIIRLRNYLEEKKKGAKKALYIAEKFDYTLTTLLIINIFNKICLTLIVFYYTVNLMSSFVLAILVTVLVLSTIILLFTEVLPRTKGQYNPEKFALRYSGILYLIIKIFSPVTYLYVKLRKNLVKNWDVSENPRVTEEELESIIDVMENEGVIEENDAEMIQNAISLSEVTVYDIMTPRVDIIAVEVSSDIEEIKHMFIEHQFSRVPVYREDKDNIIGILSEKDFFTALILNKTIDIEKMVSEPYYVSKSTKVNDLIKEMQKLQKHFAVVVDDYGGTSGIVTMEDALEEIVGEIYDEYDDIEEIGISQIGENVYSISPEVELEEMFETLNLGTPPETQFTTVGGFVYGFCDGMPYEGKIINYEFTVEESNEEEDVVFRIQLEFTIRAVENRRIKAIELKLIKTVIEE